MEVRPGANPADVKNYDTDRLRHDFLIQNLFVADEIKTIYSQIDRIIVGAATPVNKELVLEAGAELRAKYFLERREMGMTCLEPGSVWNTMPCHTHDRRMEVYLYFEVPEDAVVFHYMGEPTETRHIVMRNEEAVISPSWSIHSASATHAYTFIWGMVGENQDFDDMDDVDMKDLR